MNLDPLPTNFEEDTVEIFGIQWVTETALVNSSRVLFHLFRYVLSFFLKLPLSEYAVQLVFLFCFLLSVLSYISGWFLHLILAKRPRSDSGWFLILILEKHL